MDYGWKKPTAALIIVMLIGLILGEAKAEESDFTVHSPECKECFKYINDQDRRWIGKVSVLFNPADSGSVGAGPTRSAIEWAIETINLYIYSPLEFHGESERPLIYAYDSSRENVLLVAFKPINHLGTATLWWDWTGATKLDYAEIELSTSLLSSCLRGTALHEIVHAHGVGHSDSLHSIMYANPYNNCKYQEILRLDDIIALQSLYPARPNRQGVVTSYDANQVCIYEPDIGVDGQSYQFEACIPAFGFGEVIEN